MQSSSNPINRWGFKRNEKGGFVIPKWIWAVAGIALMLAILIVVTLPNLYRSRLESARSAQMARLGYELAGAPEEPTKPAGPMIIRTASLALVTKEVDQARTSVERLVGQYQGYIDEIRVTSEAGLARRLTATLRIPANQLDNALAELKKLVCRPR